MPFLSYSGGRGRGCGRGRGHAGSGFRRKPSYPRRPTPQRQWTRVKDGPSAADADASRTTGGYSWKREEASTSIGEETHVPAPEDASGESKATALNDTTNPKVAHTDKLVQVPPSSSEASSHTTGSSTTVRTICKYSKTNRNSPFLAAGVKRPRPSGSATASTTAITSSKSTVKRILLETDTAKDEAKDESNESSDIDTETKTAKKKKTLTDFAYRQVQHGRRLVRVDNAKAPICPTFLKGLACTDETCRMRHDAEAIPVCFFFQRQGMCLKQETCPFRHVKVPRQRQRQQRANTKR